MQVYELDEIEQIVHELKSNRAAIIETDTQLGMICLNPKLIYELKKRNKNKPLIRFVHDYQSLNIQNNLFNLLAARFWPGALTLIINGDSYRMPNHPALLKILQKTGQLFSSSANLSGHPPLQKTLDAFNIENFKINEELLFLVAGQEQSSEPSTIFNIDSGKIMRRGLIYQELVNYLKEHEIEYNE